MSTNNADSSPMPVLVNLDTINNDDNRPIVTAKMPTNEDLEAVNSQIEPWYILAFEQPENKTTRYDFGLKDLGLNPLAWGVEHIPDGKRFSAGAKNWALVVNRFLTDRGSKTAQSMITFDLDDKVFAAYCDNWVVLAEFAIELATAFKHEAGLLAQYVKELGLDHSPGLAFINLD